MKEVKILSVLTVLVLLFTLLFTGCKTENEVSSNSSDPKNSISETSSDSSLSSATSSSENSSDGNKVSSAESEESSTISSALQSSTVSATSSAVTSSTPSATSSAVSSAPTSSAPATTSSAVSSAVSSAAPSQAVSSAPSSAPSSTVVSSAPSTPSSTVSTPQKPVVTPPFTVNDPENTRGLDNTRIGCYFGVSSDDKPNQMSIDNQKRFDSYSNIKALALDTVSTDKGMYLTFDCGYEYNNLTASILDTLKAKNVKAIFFCTLSYLKRNPQLVHRMINEGHMVGNHSATHPDFTTISRTKMAEELYLFEKHLNENFGVKSKYFRFPSGNHSINSLELVTSQGYKSIFWSLAYKDWETANQPNPETAFQTITSRYHPGAVILLHAVSKTNTDILGRLIDNAHQRGYKFKSLDEYYK